MVAEAEGRSPRILLVNLHSSHNAGDHLLCEEALHQLEVQFPNASFTLAMNDPDSYSGDARVVGSFTTWVKPPGRPGEAPGWKWSAFPRLIVGSLAALVTYRLSERPWYPFLSRGQRALLETYFHADMIISAAGNFLYTSGTLGIPFLLSLFTVYYGQLARKPTYTLPQTLGPIRRRHERLLARLVLSRMRLVMLRDAISAEVWQAWKVPRAKAILIPDLAFAHPGRQHKREALALLEAGGLEDDSRPKLGVTLIHWGAQSRSFARQIEYEKAFQAMTRQFITSYGGQVIVFSQVRGPTESEDDIVPARRLLAGLEDCSDSIILMDRPVPPQVLRAAYGQMDLLVGTRLHSSIFALTEGVPVVAIGYQYKTRGIMRMLGLERWVLEIEQVSADTLSRLLRDAWSEREQTRSHLQRLLPRIREQASQAGAHIAADFRGQSRAEARGPE